MYLAIKFVFCIFQTSADSGLFFCKSGDTFSSFKKLFSLFELIFQLLLFLLFFIYLIFEDLFIFIGKADLQRQGEKRVIFHLLVHSPKCSHGRNGVDQKPESKLFFWVSHMGTGAKVLDHPSVLSQATSRELDGKLSIHGEIWHPFGTLSAGRQRIKQLG